MGTIYLYDFLSSAFLFQNVATVEIVDKLIDVLVGKLIDVLVGKM